jgi:hypothetical protein
MFAFSKIVSIFAPELSLRTSILVLVIAAFFVSACKADSIGCCFSSGSRCEALLTFAKQREQQLFLFNTFLIRQMRTSVKNATGTNNSSTRRTPSGAKSVPIIRVTLTGVRNNPYLFAIRKAFFELLVEETQGACYATYRFKKKCEAADLLYPEHRDKLRGKTVTIL